MKRFDFSNYLNPDIGSVDIGGFTGDRKIDKQNALSTLYKADAYDALNGYVLHHSAFENDIMELVRLDIHK